MFDEYFNPLPSVVSLVPAAVAPRPADLTGSPSSTSIDQAAPSTSTSSTIQETQSLVISEGVEEQLQPAYPDLEVTNDSICLKSCLETVELLKSQNDQLLKDLKKSELMVLGYKTGEIATRELKKKLEIVQKEKDGIQLNVEKFKHASKSLNKLIECQIVDNCPNYEEEPKVVRNNDDALIIEEWVPDDEEDDVSQPKTEKKTVRPSIVKKEFVKSK
ncbi:hypothetical protein Tco_1160321 [Tanacetum coccineum]